MRQSILLVLAIGCASSLRSALSYFAEPGTARVQVTLEDSLTALVLDHIYHHGGRLPPPGSVLVIGLDSGAPSPQAPLLDSVTVYVLSRANIQRVADRAGDFSYVGVGRPAVQGDSASIYVGSYRAFQRRGGLQWLDGCGWALKREGNEWRVLGAFSCLTS
jgi:hypothetical protein